MPWLEVQRDYQGPGTKIYEPRGKTYVHVPDMPETLEMARLMISDARSPLLCLSCGELFNQHVWHCPECHHHWILAKGDTCANCYLTRRPPAPSTAEIRAFSRWPRTNVDP